jgi:ribosomal protein S15
VQARLERSKKTREPGDPVRGIQTDFVRSLSSSNTSSTIQSTSSAKIAFEASLNPAALNFRIPAERLQQQLEQSRQLAFTPLDPTQDATEDEQAAIVEDKAKDRIATEAVIRIVAADISNAGDQLKANTDRCIETFGRHNTDQYLPTLQGVKREEKFRAGKDTGSSEVQIAILTAKINNLANALQRRGRKDKHNKRHLQTFVHRRQKLLRYLQRKERGGPRWQNLVNALGLTDATWQGQINI